MRHAAEWDRDSGVPEQFLALLRSEGYEYRAFGFSDDLSTLHADEFIGGFGGGNYDIPRDRLRRVRLQSMDRGHLG